MQATNYPNVSNANYVYAKPRFFKQQFDYNVTNAQRGFDVSFGIVLPILCFIFDPIFFHGLLIPDALFGSFQLFAYGVAIIEIPALTLWQSIHTKTIFRIWLNVCADSQVMFLLQRKLQFISVLQT